MENSFRTTCNLIAIISIKSHLLANMGLVEIGTSLYRFPLFIVFGELWLLRPEIKGIF